MRDLFIYLNIRNVLLGPHGKVLIGDLGFVTTWDNHTLSNAPCGSLYYASPGLDFFFFFFLCEGVGATGSVLLAENKETGEYVAIKQMAKGKLKQDQLLRVRREYVPPPSSRKYSTPTFKKRNKINL